MNKAQAQVVPRWNTAYAIFRATQIYNESHAWPCLETININILFTLTTLVWEIQRFKL